VNVNSLMNKLDLLSTLVAESNVHVLAVSETWLLPCVPSSFVALPGFSVIRGDTGGGVRKHGACLYISDRLRSVQVESELPNVVAAHLYDVDVWLLAVYRPPSYGAPENTRLMSFLTEFCQEREVIVLGDFNLPSLRWFLADVLEGPVSPHDREFLDCFDSLGLIQWVRTPTFLPSGNVLDLVLTSEPDRIGDVRTLAPLPRCRHTPVVFDYLFQFDPLGPPLRSVRHLWHRGDYGSISSALSAVDWDLEFSYSSIDDDFVLFCAILKSLIDRFVPNRYGGPAIPWSVRPPRALLGQRSEAWRNFKASRREFGRRDGRTAAAMTVFTDFNFRYRNYALLSRSRYEADLADRAVDTPKLFHSYIRRKKVGCLSVGPLRLPSGQVVSDPFEMGELFASSFASVFVNLDPADPAPFQRFEGRMDDFIISYSDVLSVLASLDGNSGMGPDGIHPRLLKECRHQLSYPLCLIFNKSLVAGHLPGMWSLSTVVPLFKGGSRYDPLNYRPISLTSVCCKSMERVIVSHLVEYLELNGLLSSDQFGFRRGRSTEDQLLLTYDDISMWVDEGFVVDLLLLDFSKAFDVVCHRVLLAKLGALGVPPVLIDWIGAFLMGRSLRVSCAGVLSGSRDVLSGVPQGSVLGPVLFLIYINYVVHGISSRFKVFADDLKLYLHFSRCSLADVERSVAVMQGDLDGVNAVASSWNLRLNPDKCVAMRFFRGSFDWSQLGDSAVYSIDGIPLEFVQSHKDLGVLVDTGLRFHLHIRAVVGQASGLANNMLRSTVNRSPEFMILLFTSHIRPILDYCSAVWHTGYLGDMRLLESVQRRWTRHVSGMGDLDYFARLRSLGLFSVAGRLVRSDLIKYWKVFHPVADGVSALPTIFSRAPDVGTRDHRFKLVVPFCTSDLRRRFFSVRCVNLWNGLPPRVAEAASLGEFKASLGLHLGDRLYQFY